MKTEILALLRNQTDYISGQELCGRFGVSRTAVWKAVNQLKEEGYEIEAVPNRGYKLRSYPDILSKSEIASRLTTQWAGKQLVYFEETGSTNVEARKLAEAGAVHGTLVVAGSQTAGRGRRGRTWLSPAGTTISMSLILRPRISADKASMLTLVQALSVTRSIEEVCHLAPQIKWPNDVLVNDHKVCGILTEMHLEMEDISSVVIGTGINVNQDEFPPEVDFMATSLKKETGRVLSRAELIERLMFHFEDCYETFMETEDLSGLVEEYNAHLVSCDRPVRVLDPKGEYTGKALGITPGGELQVRKEDGSVTLVYAGEVSIRGIYGYV
jgi:BirA family biotin operon repressor/biotin-[acetyl-CoA-carboxylase] ligase